MIPVNLSLQTSRGQTETFNFEVARDNFLTPLLLNIALYNSITANERSVGDSTIKIDGSIKIKNQEPVKIERRFTGGQAAQLTSGAVAVPVNALLRSGFDETEINEINLNVVSSVHLAKRVVKDMVARGSGRILFTSSIAVLVRATL